MGTIYQPPVGIDPPEFISGEPYETYNKRCEEFVGRVKEFCKTTSRCPEAGQEVDFPVGDGCARYIIHSLKPVKLIHLAVGDNWHYEYIHRLTAADLRKHIRNEEGLMKLFSRKTA